MKSPLTILRDPRNPTLSRIQDNVKKGLAEVANSSAISNGVLVKIPASSVSGTQPILVSHNLGRPAIGWIVVSQDQPCAFFLSKTANPSPRTQLFLTVVSLQPTFVAPNLVIWVF